MTGRPSAGAGVDGWKTIWAFLEKKPGDIEVGYIVEQGDTERSVTMCTMITTQAKVEGSGKGASGWSAERGETSRYDHPYHIRMEHALTSTS